MEINTINTLLTINTAILSIGVIIGVFVINRIWLLKDDISSMKDDISSFKLEMKNDISDIKLEMKDIKHSLSNHVTDTDRKITELQEGMKTVLTWIESQKKQTP